MTEAGRAAEAAVRTIAAARAAYEQSDRTRADWARYVGRVERARRLARTTPVN